MLRSRESELLYRDRGGGKKQLDNSVFLEKLLMSPRSSQVT